MILNQDNHAYIDSANLHKGTLKSGWVLDYSRFRIWLKEKHSVTHAYLFIGYIAKNTHMYSMLQNAGYTLIFKETVTRNKRKTKGNCDTDLVLRAICDTYDEKYDEAVIISSDGDFAGLIRFLEKNKRLRVIMSPYTECSILLRKMDLPLVFINDLRRLVELKRKSPR